MHTDEATEELSLHVAEEHLLEEEVTGSLADASDRGVPIFVEVPTEAARQRLHSAVPATKVAVSDRSFGPDLDDGRSPGRLLMVDRETILVSALGVGVVPGEDEETGLWGGEVGRGLVVWVRELLLARMARVDFETADD
jgi:hypothetical protein